jgi:hypothetical protein
VSRAPAGKGGKPGPQRSKSRSQPAEQVGGGWFERLTRLRFSFKRRGMDVQVRLEDPAVQAAQVQRVAAAADSSEAASLHAALKKVLDRHASSRAVLAHLGILEKALGAHGLKALEELPPDLMRRAMFQLETLVSDWSSAPLAALRAKVMASLVRREGLKDRRSTAERLSDFHDDKRMRVDEVSVTTFMEVNAQWERSLTGER